MRLNVTSSIAEQIRKQSEQIQKRIREEIPEILEEAGVQILSNAQLDYQAKARGGTGTDGITWKPLAPSTVKQRGRRGSKSKEPRKTKSGKALPAAGSVEIGVDTGLQRASASPGFIGADGKGGNLIDQDEHSITVGFNREYSEYFDEDRPLLPETLPDAWQEQIDDIAQDHLEKIISDELKG